MTRLPGSGGARANSGPARRLTSPRRIGVNLPLDSLRKLDRWKVAHGFRSRPEAVAHLIDQAVDDEELPQLRVLSLAEYRTAAEKIEDPFDLDVVARDLHAYRLQLLDQGELQAEAVRAWAEEGKASPPPRLVDVAGTLARIAEAIATLKRVQDSSLMQRLITIEAAHELLGRVVTEVRVAVTRGLEAARLKPKARQDLAARIFEEITTEWLSDATPGSSSLTPTRPPKIT